MLMFSSCHLHFHFTLIHGPNPPGSYAILFFTALNFTSITSHIHSWALFSLWFFILSGVISQLFSSSILGTYLSFSVLSFCLFILFMGFSRQEYWSGLPFPSPMDNVFSEMWMKVFAIWEDMRSFASNSGSQLAAGWNYLWGFINKKCWLLPPLPKILI